MAKIKRHLPMSATIAIVFHVAIVLLLVIGFQFKRETKSNPLDNINTINATVIQSETLENKPKELEKQKQDLEKEFAEQKRKQQEKEKQRLQAELEAQKKKAEEAKKQAELERKKAEEIKQQAALEKQQQEEEARKKAEQEKRIAEQKRIEEEKLAEEKRKAEEKKKKEEEAKKLAEEKKRKEEEAKKLAAEKLAAEKAAEEERLAKILEAEEAELRAAEMEAQRIAKQRAMNREIAIYQDAIRSKIQSRWRKPLTEQTDAWCKVFVRQAPGGYVEDVVIEQCTGDEAFRRSVEEAVWKSDPLPEPPIPELFHRELRFKFIPET